MKVQYTKKGDKRVEFVVKDVSYTIANAIRRAVMTYTPSMAVEKVTVYENTSPLYEEMIAQRLGMVPLTTDLKTYSFGSECKCGGKGCARCEATFIFEKSGPGTVYSGDMKARDSKVKPVYDKMPILKLGNNQKIKMEMAARLGYMSEHAKYQCALCSYKQISDTEFEFFAESYNNVPIEDIVETGLEGLEKRTEELEDAFANSKKKKAAPEEKPAKKKAAPEEKPAKKKAAKK